MAAELSQGASRHARSGSVGTSSAAVRPHAWPLLSCAPPGCLEQLGLHEAEFEMQHLTAAMQRGRHAPRADGAALDPTQGFLLIHRWLQRAVRACQSRRASQFRAGQMQGLRWKGLAGAVQRDRLVSRAGGAALNPTRGSWLGTGSQRELCAPFLPVKCVLATQALFARSAAQGPDRGYAAWETHAGGLAIVCLGCLQSLGAVRHRFEMWLAVMCRNSALWAHKQCLGPLMGCAEAAFLAPLAGREGPIPLLHDAGSMVALRPAGAERCVAI